VVINNIPRYENFHFLLIENHQGEEKEVLLLSAYAANYKPSTISTTNVDSVNLAQHTNMPMVRRDMGHVKVCGGVRRY